MCIVAPDWTQTKRPAIGESTKCTVVIQCNTINKDEKKPISICNPMNEFWKHFLSDRSWTWNGFRWNFNPQDRIESWRELRCKEKKMSPVLSLESPSIARSRRKRPKRIVWEGAAWVVEGKPGKNSVPEIKRRVSFQEEAVVLFIYRYSARKWMRKPEWPLDITTWGSLGTLTRVTTWEMGQKLDWRRLQSKYETKSGNTSSQQH